MNSFKVQFFINLHPHSTVIYLKLCNFKEKFSLQLEHEIYIGNKNLKSDEIEEKFILLTMSELLHHTAHSPDSSWR